MRLSPSGGGPELAAALAAFLDELARQALIEPCTESPPPTPTSGAPPPGAAAAPPHLLWQEDLPSVTHQVSPPHIITNPQCLP